MSRTSGSSNPFFSTDRIKTMIRNKRRLCWRPSPCYDTLTTINIFHCVNNMQSWGGLLRCGGQMLIYSLVSVLDRYLRNFNVSLKPRGRPLPTKQKWHCHTERGWTGDFQQRKAWWKDTTLFLDQERQASIALAFKIKYFNWKLAVAQAVWWRTS